MDRAQALATFRDIVAELLGTTPEEIDLGRTWESMEVDSLALTEIALVVCDAFTICLPDVDNDQIETVGQVFELTMQCILDPEGMGCEVPTAAPDAMAAGNAGS